MLRTQRDCCKVWCPKAGSKRQKPGYTQSSSHVSGIDIDTGWTIPEGDLEFRFSRSSGPGGQNVNKVSSKVELRLKLQQSSALSQAQKRRLVERYPSHVTASGEFVVVSDRHRSQHRNQADVRSRLAEMVRSVRSPPRTRVATKPSKGVHRRRVDNKRRRSETKRLRGRVDY